MAQGQGYGGAGRCGRPGSAPGPLPLRKPKASRSRCRVSELRQQRSQVRERPLRPRLRTPRGVPAWGGGGAGRKVGSELETGPVSSRGVVVGNTAVDVTGACPHTGRDGPEGADETL